MPGIIHAKQTMTSKERVKRTFEFEKTDRVPIDYSANPAIHGRLCDALGVARHDYTKLLEALGVDFRSAWPRYTGRKLFKDIPGCAVNAQYGYYTRRIENESGAYDDYCNFPLLNATDDMMDAFPVPSADDYDYDTAAEALKSFKDYGVYVGHPGIADIINSFGRVMGMEDALVKLHIEDDATLRLVDRKVRLELEIMARLLERAKGAVDFIWIGEDLGTQIAPMISMDMYKSVIAPFHQLFIDLAKSYGLPVMVHTCGSSSWVYEEFIAMGVSAVDTLQPEAANMSPEYLKGAFGGRLSFHGCISTAGKLAYGDAGEVEREVRDILRVMMPGGGYHLAPTHMIQDNTPVENVIAMYQAAHKYGVY